MDVLMLHGSTLDDPTHHPYTRAHHLTRPAVLIQDMAVLRRDRGHAIIVEEVAETRDESLLSRRRSVYQIIDSLGQKRLTDVQVIASANLTPPRQHTHMVITNRVADKLGLMNSRRTIVYRDPREGLVHFIDRSLNSIPFSLIIKLQLLPPLGN